jgi:hypothetical protein
LTGASTVSGGTSVYALRIVTGSLSGGSVNIISGGLIYAGSSPDTISSNLLAGGGTGEMLMYVPVGNGTLAFSGQIYASALTKFGAGDITLSGDNRGTLTGPIGLAAHNGSD